VRKPRAADRLCYFIILLLLRSGCFAHRSSQTNNRSSPIVTETPTKHSTPLALALKLVPSGCRQSMQLHCTKGAELPVSASRTPPHCEGRGLLSASQRRWAMHCRLFHNVPSTCVFSHMCLPQYGVRVAMALPRDAISLPRDGYCLLSLTLPCTRIRGECSCMVKWNSKEAHPKDEGGVQ